MISASVRLNLLRFMLIATPTALWAQSGQHSREYRDGCGNRYGDYVEIGSLACAVPLPPRVCKRVDKGTPSERLVIINWIEDGYREIP